jgi:hypothetical protein
MVFRIILPALLGAGLSVMLCLRGYHNEYSNLGLSIAITEQYLVFGICGTIMLIRYGLRKKHSPPLTSFVIGVLTTTTVFFFLLG